MKKISTLLLVLSCTTVFAQGTRTWATYYGGTSGDGFSATCTDASGNVFAAGNTGSTTGIASGGFQNALGGSPGSPDAFLVKFDAAGNRLWATYYGGAGNEDMHSIATDASGNVYMAGTSTSTSSIASGGFQNTSGGAQDAFLVKFDAAGNRLWATYYGGSSSDYGFGVSCDASGNVYLTGTTYSTSGIASGGFLNTYNGTGEAFLVKFDAAGNRLWGTYYGGAGLNFGTAVHTDASGNVYLAGSTDATIGIASGGFQNASGGSRDGFLAKFDAAGNLLWGTFYGGAGSDEAYAVTNDVSGNVFLAGLAQSSTGIASGGFQNTTSDNADAFLVKFDAAGNRLWATYYGGASIDEGESICTDNGGNVYLAGLTLSSSGIASSGFQNAIGGAGNRDAFLVGFEPNGTRLCASYYGGAFDDAGYGVCADLYGNLYLAGFTVNTSGVASGGFQNTFGGGPADAFLVKMVSCGPASVPEQENEPALTVFPNPTSGKFSINLQGDVFVYNSLGALVFSQATNSGTTEIDLGSEAKGIYFVEVRSGKKQFTQKLLVQ